MEPIYQPFGEIIDPSYSGNIENIDPVINDAYTTFRLYSKDIQYNLFSDFAIVKSENNGNFDFTITIADTYKVVVNDVKVRTAMEGIIKSLKPVGSRVTFKYVS